MERNYINKLQKNKQDWEELYTKDVTYWEKQRTEGAIHYEELHLLFAGKSYISIEKDMHWDGLRTGKICALKKTTHWEGIYWKKLHIERDKNKKSYTLLIERNYTNKLQKSEQITEYPKNKHLRSLITNTLLTSKCSKKA